jgi:hypothetical protein
MPDILPYITLHPAQIRDVAASIDTSPTPNKLAVVSAALHLKKSGIPAPTGRPYSIQEFDKLLAGKPEISLDHKFQIKNACFAAGIIDTASTVVTKQAAAPPIQAAKQIVSTLGLEWPDTGKKLPIGVIEAAMDAHHWTRFIEGKEVKDADRRVRAKNVLTSAGVL